MIQFTCAACGHQEEYETEESAQENGWRKINDNWYCNDDWGECEDCGGIFPATELVYMECLDREVCENCCRENYIVCERCDDYEYKEDARTVRIFEAQGGYHDETWCQTCASDYAIWNDEHDRYEYFIPSSQRRQQQNGHILRFDYADKAPIEQCKDCMELGQTCPKCLKKQADMMVEEETHLWVYDTMYRQYHPQEHKKFKKTKYRFLHEHPYLYYGIELEVLFRSSVPIDQIAKEFITATNGLFVAERDGSVADLGNGCEFISRPLSYAKWKSEEVHLLLEKGIEVLKKYNAYDPQPNGCGLHVHMSLRFFEENTEKKVKDIKSDMDWMFQIFQPEMEKISRRRYTRFCASKEFRLRQIIKNSNYGFNICPDIKLTKGKTSLTQSMGSGDTHHDCVIQTPKTIEVRTFQSTIKVNEILATIEFCRAIAHAARNMKMTKDTTLGDILSCKDSIYLDDYLRKQKVDTTVKFANSLEVKF